MFAIIARTFVISTLLLLCVAPHVRSAQDSARPALIDRQILFGDPATVELPEPDDEAEASADLPAPIRDLEPGTDEYVATISMQGQEATMNVTRTVEEVDEGWRVTESAQGPMGSVSDTEVLAKGTLTPIERSVRQGPVSVELEYSDEHIEGTLSMQGNEQSISVELDGPIFSDGAGGDLVIASLPLEEGYSATYPTLDMMSQSIKRMRVEVTGTEAATVPAGTFETYRVEIQSAEGDPGSTTMWIATDSREVVRTEQTLPQMGGATMVAELQGDAGGSE